MTQPRPTAAELLEAARASLDDDVLPQLDGRSRFHARVIANVLDMVARELRDGPAAVAAERERLVALLGHEGNVSDLTDELARALRDGTIDTANPALLDHLRRTALADADIANPRHVERKGDPT